MRNKQLQRDIHQATNQKKLAYWGLSIALLSIGFGLFTIFYDGYLIANAEPYFAKMPEDVIGSLLVIGGLIKAVGVVLQHSMSKRVGIIGLSAVWTGMLVLSTTYSFGTGHPSPSYMFMLFIVAGCYRVSLKGDFG